MHWHLKWSAENSHLKCFEWDYDPKIVTEMKAPFCQSTGNMCAWNLITTLHHALLFKLQNDKTTFDFCMTSQFFWSYSKLRWVPKKLTYDSYWSRMLQARCPSCHQTNSIKRLKGCLRHSNRLCKCNQLIRCFFHSMQSITGCCITFYKMSIFTSHF